MAVLTPDGGCWLAFRDADEASGFAARLEELAGACGTSFAPALAYSVARRLRDGQAGPDGRIRVRLGPVAFSDFCRLMLAAASAGEPEAPDLPGTPAWADELMDDVARAIDREYDGWPQDVPAAIGTAFA